MYLKTHKTNKLNLVIPAVALLIGLVYGCGNRAADVKLSSDPEIDALEDYMLDSAYSNVDHSRRMLREKMAVTSDSADYCRLLTLYGKSFFPSADYDSVEYYFQKVKHYLATSTHYSPYVRNSLLADICNTEGNMQMDGGSADSAIVLYERTYQYCLLINRTSFLPDLCVNLADAWSYCNRLDLTSHYYRRALFLSDSLKMPDRQKIPIYNGLGQTYMSLRNYALSDRYFAMADSLLPLMSVHDRFIYFNNRGNSYYYRKDYSTALQYMRRAYETVAPYAHLKYQQGLVKGNLGELFLLEGKLDSARIYIDEGYRYFNSSGNRTVTYYLRILQMALALQTDHVSQARELIEQTARDTLMSMIYGDVRNRYLEQYYRQTGNYREAYRMQQQSAAVNDSVRNDRVMEQIAEIEMRYRQDTTVLHRDIRIREQQADLENNRLHILFWTACSLLLATGLLFYSWLGRKKRELLSRRYHEQLVRSRMENLRSNVSPHFIFNVLGHELQQFAGHEEVKSRLLKLVHYLRHSLKATDCLVVSLSEELRFVDEYIRLSTVSFGDTFTCSLDVDPAIDTETFQVPSMIIQIPVENAIKHGLSGLEGEKTLHIRVTTDTDGICILVNDNGRGYQPDLHADSRGTGTGLRVINQTIYLLNRRNKTAQISFDIRANQTGDTEVVIHIPTTYTYSL
ncbi:MAG: histidine kinase [Prevotellaceae bacterium]|nr:histidine kinase [Prevotellaceae bacterium]